MQLTMVAPSCLAFTRCQELAKHLFLWLVGKVSFPSLCWRAAWVPGRLRQRLLGIGSKMGTSPWSQTHQLVTA